MKKIPNTCDNCPFCICYSDLKDFCVASEERFKTPFGKRHEKCPLIKINLVSELEEIKAEIDRLYNFYMYIFKENVVIKSDVMQVLDKHIAEPKGEQE